MKKHIEKLERELNSLKETYKAQERIQYEKQNHITFKKGDWIKKGHQMGRVGWIENSAMGITEDMGYCGVDIKSGIGGFGSFRRDEWELVSGDTFTFLTKRHKISIYLNGEQIMQLVRSYKNVNSNESTKYFMSYLINLIEKLT